MTPKSNPLRGAVGKKAVDWEEYARDIASCIVRDGLKFEGTDALDLAMEIDGIEKESEAPMNKKPRATREPRTAARPKRDKPPTEWVFWFPGRGMGIPSEDRKHVEAMRDKYGHKGILCRAAYTPVEEVKSPKGSAQAKPKPSQSHPQPRRPKK